MKFIQVVKRTVIQNSDACIQFLVGFKGDTS